MRVSNIKSLFRFIKKTPAFLGLVIMAVSGCAVPDPEQAGTDTGATSAVMSYINKEESKNNVNIAEQKKVSLTQMISPVVFDMTREKYSYINNWMFTYVEDNDAIYMCDSDINEANTGRDHFLRKFENGEETVIMLPEIPFDNMVSKLYCSKDNLFLIVETYRQEEGISQKELYAYSKAGDLLFHKPVMDFISGKEAVFSAFSDMKGGLWLVSPSEGLLYRVDANGDVIQTVTIPTDYPGIFINGRKDNTLIAATVSKSDLHIERLDIAESLSDRYMFEGMSGIQAVYGGEYSDLLALDNNRLYRVTLGDDAKMEEALVFTDYGIDASEIQMVRDLDDGGYVIVLKNRASADVERRVLRPSDAAAKREITVACLRCPDYLRFAVRSFNERSSDVKITIKSYYDRYAIDSSMEEILNKFNSDLMDKTAGDIICLSGIETVADRDEYLNKGLFIDLYELMERDSEFDKNEYFTNVWRVNETDGSLFTMVPVFSLNTKYALKSDVGDVNHLDESILFDTDDPLSLYGQAYNRDLFLHDICVFSLGNISDENAAIFDVDELEKYFTFAAGLPDYEMYESNGNLSEEYFALSIHNKTLSGYYNNMIRFAGDRNDKTESYLIDIRDASVYLGHHFTVGMSDSLGQEDTKEVVAAGFPTKEGNGTAIVDRLELAIPVYTDQVETVWDFMKFVLSEEFQGLDACFQSGLPVNKRVYEEWTGRLIEYESPQDDPHYMTGIGFADEVTGQGICYDIPPTKQWMVDEVAEAIEKADYLDKTDANAEAILKEELLEYAQGRCTATEAAKSAAERIRLYADERK